MQVLNQANELFKNGKFQEAKEKYEEFIKANPELLDIFQINIELCNRKINYSDLKCEAVIARVNNPKISIIVPVYNVEKYLDQCISSILNQSLKEIELILVNDGSIDKSLDIIKKFEEKDKRVIIINNSHASGNSGMPRNQALMKATGEYIAFVDSDDWIEATMLEDLYAQGMIQEADIVASGGFFREKGETTEEVKVINGEFLPEKHHRQNLFLGGQFPIVWYRIYKRELILNNGIRFGETKTSADLPFAFKALFLANKVIQIENSYYHYRFDREGSTIERRKGKAAFELLKSYENIEKFLRDKNLYEQYIAYVVYKAIGDYTYNLRLLDQNYHEAFSIAIANLVFKHKKYLNNSNIFNKYWLSILSQLECYENKESKLLTSILNNAEYQPKISIIIPAYNVEKYITRSIGSILNQKIREIEIIIINDGSSDKTQDIINDFLSKDERIKSIDLNLSSGNAGTPRNIGLAIARGEYIGFVDSDDWVTPSMFETLYEGATNSNADIVSESSFYRHEGDKEVKVKIDYKEFSNPSKRAVAFESNYFSNIWNRIYSTKLIKEKNIYFPKIYLAEDMSFSFVAHAFAHKTKLIGGAFYHYLYNREDSTTELRTGKKGFDIISSFNDVTHYFKTFGIYDTYASHLVHKKLNSLWYTYDRMDAHLKDDFLRQMKELYKEVLKEHLDINLLTVKDKERIKLLDS